MTVALRHNAALELNRVEFSGSVTAAELAALADFQSDHPRWLPYDCLNIILPHADFDSIAFDSLNGIFVKYRSLFEPMQFVILRRSAWICQSLAAEAHLHHWMANRNTRDGMSTDVRRFNSIAEACDWLILSAPHAADAESGAGFDDIIRYTLPAEPARVAAR
ncbi:MAG: hypothetical protein HY054_09250 [Proteobacteria bacterium]|nr:hypothetical protein [Pseudomonadota bacterium]